MIKIDDGVLAKSLSLSAKSMVKISACLLYIFMLGLTIFNVSIIAYTVVAQGDESPPTFSNPSTNTTLAAHHVKFTVHVTDDNVLNSSAGYIFSTNNTGGWENSSFTYFEGSGDTLVATNSTLLNDTVGAVVQWKFYANDTFGNWNLSASYNLTTGTTKKINITIYNSTGGMSGSSINIYNSTNDLIELGSGGLAVDLTQYENYTFEISEEVGANNITARIVNLNVTGEFNITTQAVEDYSAQLPLGYNKITPVFAINDTELTYSYATIYIPNGSFTITKILHCNGLWDYTEGGCDVGGWEVDEPSGYDAKSNASHTFFNVTSFDGYGGGGNVYLEVELVLPPGNTFVERYTLFDVNATVYCRGGSCSDVNGTAMYNSTEALPNTPVNTTYDEEPFFVNETPAYAQKTCGDNPLSENEWCNLTWKVNATGALGTGWEFGVKFNSTDADIDDNHTDNVTLTIVSCLEEMTIHFSEISFGTLYPSTQGNVASENENNYYNITNTGTCTSNIWIKSTNILKVPEAEDHIGYSNISFNNMTDDFGSSFRIGDDYSSDNSTYKRSVSADENATGYFFIDVPIVYSGDYSGNITFCVNSSSRGTLC